jgi:hypothetical protein
MQPTISSPAQVASHPADSIHTESKLAQDDALVTSQAHFWRDEAEQFQCSTNQKLNLSLQKRQGSGYTLFNQCRRIAQGQPEAAVLGTSSRRFGAVLGSIWTLPGNLGAIFGPLSAIWRHFGPRCPQNPIVSQLPQVNLKMAPCHLANQAKRPKVA